MFLQASVLATLAASASAHLILHSPVPFAFEDSANRQAPLEPEQFPCKQPSGAYAVTEMNKVAAGDSLSVQIMGGATHGGGSCQFSITTDTKPNKDSQWKVLHSQIHGCLGGPNNLNMSPNAEDLGNPKIPVKIPADLPAGQYTFAWSWFNKMGNREFYMNCAPLEVSGGSGGDVSKVLGGLPDMFVANLPNVKNGGAAGCTVAEGQDFVYPDPGESVTTGEGAVPGTAMEGAGCAAQNALGKGAGKLAPPTGGAPTTPDTPPKPSTPADPATPPTPPTVPEAPKPSPTDGGHVLAPSAAPAPPTTPVTPPVTPPATGGKPAGCTPCTKDGAVVCIDKNSFGLCNFGCAVPQPLAAGMKCTEGAIIGARDVKLRRAVHKHAAAHGSLL